MILLINDGKDKRIERLHENLQALGIISVAVESGRVREYSEACCAFVIAGSENELNIVSVRCGKLPLLAVNESDSRIYNKDVVFYSSSCGSHENFIIDYLRKVHGITGGTLKIGALTVGDASVSYGVNSLKLTGTERNILRLLGICKGKWISEENIERICFESSGTSCRVSVHICNINRKFREFAGRNLIRCKRGIGYILEEGL